MAGDHAAEDLELGVRDLSRLRGAGEENRTPDLLITSEPLYRLSYPGGKMGLRQILRLSSSQTKSFRPATPSFASTEFAQLTGTAGRRGILARAASRVNKAFAF